MAATARENVLVTLACPHFAVFPPSAYQAFSRAFALDDVGTWRNLLSTHSEPQWSLDSLSKLPPTTLIPLHLKCGRAECSSHHENWGPALHQILIGLRDFWNERKIKYLRLAAQFFNMLPCMPASAMRSDITALAHQCFVIETRDWDKDPFFESWREASCALEITAANASQRTFAPTHDVLRHIVRGTPELIQLTNVIERMKQLYAQHLEKPRPASVFAPRQPRRRVFPIERDIDSPKGMFCNKACRAWCKRMAGFEDFQDFGIVEVIERQPEPEMDLDLDDVDELPTLHRFPPAGESSSESLASEMWLDEI